MRRDLITIVAALAVILAPAAVVAGAPGAAARPAPAAVGWGACPPVSRGYVRDPRQQCATLRVPLDYRDPRGRTIELAISRIATATPAMRRGILLSNPGGPGEPGLDLPSTLAGQLPAAVLDRYDLIGLDPRGLGHSSPITCRMPLDQPDLLFPWPAPDGDIARNVAHARAVARSCAEHSGGRLPFITTANTARDLDRIRAALGEPRISFYGRSYGTYLGTVYDTLYPHRSDRMVLDSGVDPRKVWYHQWRSFAPAVASRFPDFTRWAAARDATYHLGSTPEAVERTYYRLAAALDARPLPSPEPSIPLITGNVFRELTRQWLYFDSQFPFMAQAWQYAGSPADQPPPALARALRTRPADALVPADNPLAGLNAVVCNDAAWPRDLAVYRRAVAADRREHPLTAGMPANVWPCAFWHYRPIEPPVTVTDRGRRNILILQNRRDPAVPWISGLGLRTVLGQRAVMVTVDAGAHVAYGRGTCADAATHTFLATGLLPARDQSCAGPVPGAGDRFGPVGVVAGRPGSAP